MKHSTLLLDAWHHDLSGYNDEGNAALDQMESSDPYLDGSIFRGGNGDASSYDVDDKVNVEQPCPPVPTRKVPTQLLKPVLNQHRSWKPNTAHEQICTYDMTEEEAPLHQVFIVFKRLSLHSPMSSVPHQISHISHCPRHSSTASSFLMELTTK